MIAAAQCEICKDKSAKYCCPGCEMKTCSLPCVKKHKEDTNCLGQRIKTKYVPVGSMDDLTLLSDLRFLEDTNRTIENGMRDNHVQGQDYHFFVRKMAGKSRGKGINLRFMPSSFSKRRHNSTFYHTRMKVFFWQVELVFPIVGLHFIEKKLHEKTYLEDFLSKYLGPKADPHFKDQLQEGYGNSGPHDVAVFLKADGTSGNQQRYHQLSVSQSILHSLQGKMIIEFPTLYIVPPDHAKKYTDLTVASLPALNKEQMKEDTTADLNFEIASKKIKLDSSVAVKQDPDFENGEEGELCVGQ